MDVILLHPQASNLALHQDQRRTHVLPKSNNGCPKSRLQNHRRLAEGHRMEATQPWTAAKLKRRKDGESRRLGGIYARAKSGSLFTINLQAELVQSSFGS